MKTKLFSILAASALAFTACSDENTPGPIVKGEKDLIGNIEANTTLDANIEYTMTGTVLVKSGATLTIPAGTTIKATAGGTNVYLLVEKGGKLVLLINQLFLLQQLLLLKQVTGVVFF